ncbi:hypothetical protein RhiirC2_871153 [Rhizophagus irregularis]|uniref:Uncharacterized protein n=1 Tax=Rhizophagus irregularis TaxID=588596 RepID=A0A2N1MDV4_9GLOM|nr:hypothetical protein RhiirC2_871153 [Rhizophagus irregularis]
MKRLQLELSSQSTPYSEKDKLASVSYDFDGCSTGYKAYLLAKATVAENTMSSAPNFEPAYIPPARQEMVSPTSYQSSAPNETISEIFISSRKKFLGIIGYYQKVKNPETQEEYAKVCEEFYAYFRKYYSKYIGIIDPIKLTPPYEEYVYCFSSSWIEAKKYQLERRLNRARYGITSDFSSPGRFLLNLLSTIAYYESTR